MSKDLPFQNTQTVSVALTVILLTKFDVWCLVIQTICNNAKQLLGDVVKSGLTLLLIWVNNKGKGAGPSGRAV